MPAAGPCLFHKSSLADIRSRSTSSREPFPGALRRSDKAANLAGTSFRLISQLYRKSLVFKWVEETVVVLNQECAQSRFRIHSFGEPGNKEKL